MVAGSRSSYESAKPTSTLSAASMMRLQELGFVESNTMVRKKTNASIVSLRVTPRSDISVPYSRPRRCASTRSSCLRRRGPVSWSSNDRSRRPNRRIRTFPSSSTLWYHGCWRTSFRFRFLRILRNADPSMASPLPCSRACPGELAKDSTSSLRKRRCPPGVR